MEPQLITPNLHVALIHFPIGLIVMGTFLEVFSFLGWRRGGLRVAARWMILVGVICAVPAALSGAYALHQAAIGGTHESASLQSWSDTAAESAVVQSRASWNHLVTHLQYESFATGIMLLVVAVWLASSDEWRRRLHVLLLATLLAGVGLTLAGAGEGGEAVYEHRVGVRAERRREPPATAVASAPTTVPQTSTSPGVNSVDSLKEYFSERGVSYFAPPLQTHVILAGFVIGIATCAIGLSIRAACQTTPIVDGDDLAAALASPMEPPPVHREHTARPDRPVSRALVPPARFWMLALLLSIATAAGGWWAMARSGERQLTDFVGLWDVVRDPAQNSGAALTRRVAHLGAGAGIIALVLLLALVTRLAPRSRFFLGILILVLLACVVAQVWFGVLLMYDSNSGPVMRFN
ncbi:MAG: DUF2231 domain-containing protein [Tepidisphaeraceae bacterium]